MNFINPITFPSIENLLVAMLNVVIVISTPIVVFFLIYSGFMFVTAQGNPEKLEAAKKSIVYSIIGGVIIIGSVAITAIVSNTIKLF